MSKEQQEHAAFEALCIESNVQRGIQHTTAKLFWQWGKEWQARTPEVEALRAEVLALQERLEITHCHDGDGSRVEIPDSERKDFPDGIYCRDETIRLLEESNEALRAKLREYEGSPAVEGKPWEIQTRDELLHYARELLAEISRLTDEANAGRQAEE